MNKLKIISLTASMVLAMVFTFSCSADDEGGGVTSSSVEDGESSSSKGGEGNSQTYSYCLLSGEKMCLDGPFTSKDCNTAGGYPSNSCPYGGVQSSSSSVDGEQGGESSSSSDMEQSSSSIETAYSSSSEDATQSSSSVKKENCGTQEYDPSTHHCYYGNLYVSCIDYLQQVYKCDGKYLLLQCGTTDKYYNITTEFCSSNEVYSKCNGRIYSPTVNKICRNDVILTKCGVTDEYYNDETEFCRTNLIYPKCNGLTYDLSQKCENGVILDKCGTTDKYYNSVKEFCLDGDIHALCNGQTYNPTAAKCNQNGSAVRNLCSGVEYDPYSQYCVNGTVGYKGNFTDERDGNTYTYVTINTQTWMAENLKYNVVGSVCYDNLASNCEKYGKLYNWATAMAIDMIYNSNSYTAQAKHQGICPTGWHLPSKAEWEVMTAYIGDVISSEGKKLKTTSGWNDNGNGTDEYGFSALPSGNGLSGGSFGNVGKYGYWWSASEVGNDAYFRGALYAYDGSAHWGSRSKSDLYSVRCIKD